MLCKKNNTIALIVSFSKLFRCKEKNYDIKLYVNVIFKTKVALLFLYKV